MDQIPEMSEIVAQIERRIQQHETELEKLRRALADLTGRNGSAARAPLKPETKATKKPRGEGQPFKPKYSETSRTLAVREFEAVHPQGLTLRQLQDRLSKKALEFSDQAMMHALKKMVKDKVLRRFKAPPGSSSKYQFALAALPQTSGQTDQNA